MVKTRNLSAFEKRLAKYFLPIVLTSGGAAASSGLPVPFNR